ncbi:spore coat protein [Thalassobacillus devorans]|uniref:Spore coat protein n=1 Tax=Thalassobacillus devorans TaxID=279813 RepID=A0ABQ1PLY2_9BACI|nr:CotY/CotZ family spore coat protein [Thalassobacillus devorans]NIK30244.1 spore coat protein Z [Thalassobacillus devorans]GGC99548.1 spore coat protein [Thalassobacillus devorans]
MSCGKHDFDTCVCETVRKIIKAQDEVAGVGDDCCDTGCEQSIRDLLSPVGNGNGPTTIPFFLYCKGDCDPFIGSGVTRQRLGMSQNFAFQCVESPIFRAKKFVDKDECCVQLELLLPVNEGGQTPGPGGDTVCDFFPGNAVRDFLATGICITVDLDCFCGIACLDPVTPLPSSELTMAAADASKNC